MAKIIVSDCESGRVCPTILDDGDGTLIIQGYIAEEDFEYPAGEHAVRIPADLLLAAAEKLRSA